MTCCVACFYLSYTRDKGKPAERQGRKATDLRVNSYDSGVTDILEQASFDAFNIYGFLGIRYSVKMTCLLRMGGPWDCEEAGHK